MPRGHAAGIASTPLQLRLQRQRPLRADQVLGLVVIRSCRLERGLVQQAVALHQGQVFRDRVVQPGIERWIFGWLVFDEESERTPRQRADAEPVRFEIRRQAGERITDDVAAMPWIEIRGSSVRT